MRNIDFKDTDKKLKIKIYDIEFEVNVKKLEEINKDELNENNDVNKILDDVLGKGTCEKLNQKRKENGYEELDSGNGLAIFSAIMTEYLNHAMQPVDEILENYKKRETETKQYMNRQERRYYNKKNYNRGKRKYY